MFSFIESKRGFKTKKEAMLYLSLKGFKKLADKTEYLYSNNQSAIIRKSINNVSFRIDFYLVKN